MAKKDSKNHLFTINGFEVYEDSVYVVKDKQDFDAPTGFINAGVTKLPSRGVGETFQVRFVSRDGGRTGVWDTGFDEYSPCYKDVSPSEAAVIAKGLVKNVLIPYRKALGDDKIFEKGNEDSFLKTRFFVDANKTYNTNDPVARMELYMGLLTNQLTPKGQEGNAKFNDSSYVVIDINKSQTTKAARDVERFNAIGAFSGMLKGDRARLLAILEYSGLAFSRSVDDTTLISMFNDYLSNGAKDNRIEMFNSLVEETDTKEGMEKLTLYKALKDEFKKPNSKVTKSGGVYFFDGIELGPELKSSVENIMKNSKLSGVRTDLLIAE